MSSQQNQNIAFAFMAGALVVAVAATWGIFELLDRYEQQAEAQEEEVSTVQVVAANRTLYQGVAITSEDVFVVKVPPEYLPRVEAGELAEGPTEADTFSTRERVIGRLPRERILANEFIRPERLADGNAGVGLNAVLPSGMRAVSLDLRDNDAISGFLEPGNLVDVLVTMQTLTADTDGRGYEKVEQTETILQTVMVLGVNSKAEDESDADVARRGKQRPSVTFLVTQSQAEQLAFANQMGKVSLSLRNVLDSAYTDLPGVQLDDLLNRIRPVAKPQEVVRVRNVAPRAIRSAPKSTQVAAPAPTSSGPTIRVIRGQTAAEVSAQNPSGNGTRPLVIHGK